MSGPDLGGAWRPWGDQSQRPAPPSALDWALAAVTVAAWMVALPMLAMAL